MKLPVDTSAIAFLCAVEAEPVVDFETKRPRADENGEPLYVVQLIAMTDGAADIIAVKCRASPARASARVTRSGCMAWSPSLGPCRTARGWRSGRPASSRPSPLPRRADRRGGGAQATVRQGTGAALTSCRSPPPTRPGASTLGPCIRSGAHDA
jgi:hypothetical protein